jgi:hypothetical protein
VVGDGVSKVSEAFRLERVKVVRLGDDLVVIGYVAK